MCCIFCMLFCNPKEILWRLFLDCDLGLRKLRDVCKRACKVHVKIYDAYEIYANLTYRTKKWFLNFIWLICLYFCISTDLLFTGRFIQTFFLHKYKNIPHWNLLGLSKDIQFFLSNYCFIVVICVLFFLSNYRYCRP